MPQHMNLNYRFSHYNRLLLRWTFRILAIQLPNCCKWWIAEIYVDAWDLLSHHLNPVISFAGDNEDI